VIANHESVRKLLLWVVPRDWRTPDAPFIERAPKSLVGGGKNKKLKTVLVHFETCVKSTPENWKLKKLWFPQNEILGWGLIERS
jgi:hypothetical protein